MEGIDAERTRFSSCRGVSFEIKIHDSLGPPFSTGQGTTAQVHPMPVHSFRSSSHPSSHFCDILGDDEHLENVPKSTVAVATADPEKPQAVQKLKGNDTRRKAAAFAIYNLLVLTLCRSEAFLRIVFWFSVKALGKPRVPLWMKTAATSLLQSIGGIHSGCGVSSVAWLVYALVMALQHRDDTCPEIIVVASVILSLLFLSCFLAFPLVRHVHHNLFERTHWFAGWAALALLWVFVVLTAGYNPKTNSYNNLTASRLAGQQEIWLTLLVTVLTALPWITVRRVPVSVTSSSGHASLLKFSGGVKAGLLGRISRSPLAEWHAFGIISDNKDSHMMLAGAVGDFTKRLVSDPPTHLWVRRVHFAGLPYLVNMYNRVVLVATGSGIAVFLSFLLQPCDADVCLVWITKSVDHNFGPDIHEMLRGHPQGKVIIHDTAVSGRPNVAMIAVDTAKMWNAEAVVVTSNPQGSRDVVIACRAEGIAAYGPIWDS
ncbi:adenylate-forming reductase 06235-like [Wolffia australiana]